VHPEALRSYPTCRSICLLRLQNFLPNYNRTRIVQARETLASRITQGSSRGWCRDRLEPNLLKFISFLQKVSPDSQEAEDINSVTCLTFIWQIILPCIQFTPHNTSPKDPPEINPWPFKLHPTRLIHLEDSVKSFCEASLLLLTA
jgi:hypothetical protein